MEGKRRGNYTVFEGLDGVGKGTVISAVRTHLVESGKHIEDLERREFERDFEKEPVSRDGLVLAVSEPTYSQTGATIRGELIARNTGRIYSAHQIAQGYSLDRHVLLRRVLLPALEQGADVLSSRNFVSSLCYQALGAIKEGRGLEDLPKLRDELLSLEGNAFALKNAPDLVIISTIKDVDALMARLAKREKNDDCKFENPDFQRALKPLYEDSALRELLEKAGSKVAYLDAGISIPSSREQAVEIYRDFYERGEIQPRYRNP